MSLTDSKTSRARRWVIAAGALVLLWAFLVVYALLSGGVASDWRGVLISGPVLVLLVEGIPALILNGPHWARYDHDRSPWQRWLARTLALLCYVLLAAAIVWLLVIWLR